MQPDSKHHEIRQRIADGETGKAFQQFLALTKGSPLADEAERLYARFAHNEKELQKGIAADKEALPERDEIIIDFYALLQQVSCHTLVVEFLAKTCAAQGWPPEKMVARLREQGLAHLDTKAEMPTGHNKNQRANMVAHISALFDINLASLNEHERWLLANLSMLPPFAHAYSVLEEMLFFQRKEKSGQPTFFNRIKLFFFPEKKRMKEKERPKKEELYPLLIGLATKGYLEKHLARRPTQPDLEDPASEEDGFYMHPVMAEVVREKENPSVEMCDEMVGYFIDRYHLREGSKNPALAFAWLPYGEVLAGHLPEHIRTGALANNLSLIYQDQGELPSALRWQQKTISIQEKVLGQNHLALATSYTHLSRIYQAQGELPSALKWQQEAIFIQKKMLEENHPDLAASYNNLSLIHKDLGGLSWALKQELKEVATKEKTLGKDAPLLSIHYTNVSLSYSALGDFPSALEWRLKDIAIREIAFGKDHHSLGSSYSGLSMIYNSQGDFPSALAWQFKSIAIVEKTRDKDHPELAASYSYLSEIYRAQGDMAAALEWEKEAMPIREKALGEGHSSLAHSYDNLSQLYQTQGDVSAALEWQWKYIEIQEKALWKHRPYLAESPNNLSQLYQDSDDLLASLEWQRKAIEVREKVQGENHPDLGTSYGTMASMLDAIGKSAEALPFIQRAVAICQHNFPKGHSDMDKALGWLERIQARAAHASKGGLPNNGR